MAYTKRKDGRWQTTVTLDNGKRKYIYAKTEKELKRKETEMLSLLERGYDVDKVNLTFTEWSNRAFESYEGRLNHKEHSTFIARVTFFLDYFGYLPINRITAPSIRKALESLSKENPYTHTKTSTKTLYGYLFALNRVFEYAIECRVTDYNPCKSVIIKDGKPAKHRRALTTKEQKMVIETYHPLQTSAMIMMLCGLRRGELTALTFEDINLKEKKLIVNKSFNFREYEVKSPKTFNGYREIPIPDILVEHLLSLGDRSGLVISNDGNYYTESMWKRRWEKYMDYLDEKYADKTDYENTKINRFGCHDLRHTYCTNLYYSNCPVALCKTLMGHSDIKTTLNIYTHLDEESKCKTVDDFNTFLEEKYS